VIPVKLKRKMKQQLTEICGFKIQSHRRALLTKQQYECRYKCDGHNISCKDYIAVQINPNHYLIINLNSLDAEG